MKKTKNYVRAASILGLMALVSTGCSHSAHTRGSVALKENDQEAHVCLGDKEVKAGDKVALFKNQCTGSSSAKANSGPVCTKVKLGEGVVTKTLNEHYSNIRVNSGVSFDEGAIVEKID